MFEISKYIKDCMCKYLLDLIGFNCDEPLVDYKDSKLKLSITNIFSNLTFMCWINFCTPHTSYPQHSLEEFFCIVGGNYSSFINFQLTEKNSYEMCPVKILILTTPILKLYLCHYRSVVTCIPLCAAIIDMINFSSVHGIP